MSDPIEEPIEQDGDQDDTVQDRTFTRCVCTVCGASFLTRCNRARCARCFLGGAADKGYWQSEAERFARTEAQRILNSPEVAAMREHVRATLREWEANPIWQEAA